LRGADHRDLKPSNALVTEQDGAPVPKVIDFGIAKATDKWAVENTLLTQFGQIVGTPEYASPEQADTMTGDIDESSDVYSLGVLLYELLIGAVPFDTATLRNAGLAEMLRIIREDEAPSLLRKLTSMGAAVTDIAARRQTDPVSLRRLVDGDLNSITMKALEKARERRYASVSDLAADIQRHIEHRPVLASPPGRLYRTRKFHRLSALAAAAGVVGQSRRKYARLVAIWAARRAAIEPSVRSLRIGAAGSLGVEPLGQCGIARLNAVDIAREEKVAPIEQRTRLPFKSSSQLHAAEKLAERPAPEKRPPPAERKLVYASRRYPVGTAGIAQPPRRHAIVPVREPVRDPGIGAGVIGVQ
jgi:hypothetical protein